MSQQITSTDSRLRWQGAISLQQEQDWVMPWRIPHEQQTLFHPQLIERAAMPAGMRLTFRSDTSYLAGQLVRNPGLHSLDLHCNSQFIGSAGINLRSAFRFENLPVGEKLLELWLPHYGEFQLRSLEIDDGATIAPYEDERPRWITYGSSITQCRAATSPAQTWPAIVARESDYHLTCLGYGGQCHLDIGIARLIRDRPADFLSICVGINIYGAASLGIRTFRSSIIDFIQILREGHPGIPLAVISPIYSPSRESTLNAVSLTLQIMREEVAEAVSILQASGDRHLHYVDGLTLFDASAAHLLPDGLHPNAEGYQLMGKNFIEKVVKVLFVNRELAGEI